MLIRRFSNDKYAYKQRPKRAHLKSRKKLRGVLKKHKRKHQKQHKHVTFAYGTKTKFNEPKLLTAKQKKERGYDKQLKYCLGPEY